MGLFDESDFEELIDKMGSAPDGVLDGLSYLDTFKKVYDYFFLLDHEDEVSRMKFMMNIMNLVTTELDKDFDHEIFEVVAVLSFHLLHLFGIVHNYEEDFKGMYLSHLREKVIPDLEENSGAVPYWE